MKLANCRQASKSLRGPRSAHFNLVAIINALRLLLRFGGDESIGVKIKIRQFFVWEYFPNVKLGVGFLPAARAWLIHELKVR